jgi:hypothetical protein
MRTEEQRTKRRKAKWEKKHPDEPWPGYIRSPEQRNHISEAATLVSLLCMDKPSPMLGKTHTDETKKKMSKSADKYWENPGVHQKHSKLLKKHYENPLAKKKISEAGKKSYRENPTRGQEHSKTMKKYFKDPEVHIRQSEIQKKINLEKRWYGDVTYNDRDKYCILFNKKFKERCLALFNYKSVLSGKTQLENIRKGKPIQLTVHHVYYQKKACCKWDEDQQGYYAMINLGTKRKPNLIRHNIKGDPNKFVVLTHVENTVANHDKLKWIKLFENIIENQGGKCYYTLEEYDQLVTAGILNPEDFGRKVSR